MVKAGLRPSAATAVIAALLASCGGRDSRHAARAVRDIEAALDRGEVAAALELAERNARLWQGRMPPETGYRFRLLEADALIQTGRSPEANALLSPLRIPPESPLEVERETLLARTLVSRGDLEGALRTSEGACRLAGEHGWNAVWAQALIVQGLVRMRAGDYSGSDAVFLQARRIAQELHNVSQQMTISLDLGLNRLKRSEYDAAIPYFEQAHSLADSTGELKPATIALANLSECYYNLGNFDRALELTNRVIATEERIDSKLSLINSYGHLGDIYFLRGEARRAAASYQRSLQLARALDSGDRLTLATSNLAMARIELEEWQQAETLNGQADALAKQLHDGASLPRIRLNAAAIAAGQGDASLAMERYHAVAASDQMPPDVLWDAHAALAKLYAAAGDLARAGREYETALRSIEQKRAELSKSDYKLTFLTRLIRFYQNYVELLIEQGDERKALQIADSSRARVLAERANAGPGGAGATVEEMQAVARASNAVLVSYWLAPQRSVVWIVDAGGVHMQALTESAAGLQSLVDTYAAELETDMRDPVNGGSATGAKLYAALIDPIRLYLGASKRVIVVPDGALHNLNFETLPAPAASPGTPRRYWIEDAILSVAPSLGLLAEKRPVGSAARGILLMGNPEPNGPYALLPHAEQEIEAIRSHFSSRDTRVFMGRTATPALYRSSHPEQFALIHFTAHAEANRESPLDSAVILSKQNDEYKLYGREVMNTGLQARLVTVSACRSAGAKAYSGEGLVGFAWAFLHAGASNVIAGLWDVDDSSTARLMDRLYNGLAAREAPDVALREAKLSLLHGSTANYRKPYYWGAMQVFRRTAE